MIDKSTLEAISSRVQMSDIAALYFPVRQSSNRFKALCPFHSEKTPSFSINNQRNSYKCFGCGAGGSIFRFIMEMERLPFPDAVKFLGRKAGIEVEEQDSEAVAYKRGLESVSAKASTYFFSQLIESKESKTARIDLKKRGFDSQLCKDWGIGYAPNTYELQGDKKLLISSGLVVEDNCKLFPRFRDRIMFSIHDESGRIVGFSGRTTTKNNHPAKYLNSPDSALFRKGDLLYGLNRAKKAIIDTGTIILVEGQVDVIKCHISGFTNTVAPLGTAFTEQQAKILRRLADKVVIVFDGDKAGLEAARKAFCLLAPLGLDVRWLVMPDKQDPDEYLSSGKVEEFKQQIESTPPFIDRFTKLVGPLQTPQDKVNAAKRIGELISKIDEAILRDAIITNTAMAIGITKSQFQRYVKVNEGEQLKEVEPSQINESLRNLLLHILYCGRDKIIGYKWEILSNPILQSLLDAKFEPGNEASIALVLSQLPPGIEKELAGDICVDSLRNLDIKACYLTLLNDALMKKKDLISSQQCDIMELQPIIAEIIEQQKEIAV